LRPFDYHSITDVILILSYTAEEDGALREQVESRTATVTESLLAHLRATNMTRVFSLRQEFSSAFNRLVLLAGEHPGHPGDHRQALPAVPVGPEPDHHRVAPGARPHQPGPVPGHDRLHRGQDGRDGISSAEKATQLKRRVRRAPVPLVRGPVPDPPSRANTLSQ
jgi:hypothetical protein